MTKKWVLFIVILLIAVAVSAQAMLQSQFYSNKIKRFVEAQLEELVGESVSVGGAMVNLFSSSLILKGVKISPAGLTQSSFFTAEQIEIKVSPGSIFTEVFLVRSVEIEKPVVKFSAEDVKTVSALRKDTPEDVSNTEPKLAFVIQEIKIRDGDLALSGEGMKGDVFTLFGVSSEIKPDLSMRQFGVQLSAQKGQVISDTLTKDLDALEVEVFIQPEAVEIKKIFASSGKITLLGDGQFHYDSEDPLDIHLDLNLPLEDIPLTGLHQDVQDYFSEQQVTGSAGFIGRLRGSAEEVSLAGKLHLQRLNLGGEEAASIQGDLVYKDRHFNFSELTGTLFSGEFSGNLEAGWPMVPKEETGVETQMVFNGEIQYKNIPLDKAFLISPFQEEVDPLLTKGLFVSGYAGIKRSKEAGAFEGAGQVRVMRLPLFSPPVRPASNSFQKVMLLLETGGVDWELSSDRLTLKAGKFTFPETDASFRGEWSREAGLVLHTELSSLEIDEITRAIDLPLKGKLYANGLLTYHEDQPGFQGGLLLESGTLRGQAFSSLISEVQFKEKTVTISKAVLNVPPKKPKAGPETPAGFYRGKGELDLSDQQMPHFDFSVDIESGNPQEVFHFLDLEVPLYSLTNGSVVVRGTPGSFIVKGPLHLEAGTLYGEKFEKGQVDLTVSEKEVLLENAVLSYEKSLMTGRGAIGYDETYRVALKGEGLRIQNTTLLDWMPPTLRARIGLVVNGEGSFNRPQLEFTAVVNDVQYSGFSAKRGRIRAEWQNKTIFFEAEFPEKNIAIDGEVKVKPTYPYSFSGTFEQFPLEPFFKEKLSGPVADVKVVASGKLSGSGELFNPALVNLTGTLTDVVADFGTYQLQNDGPMPVHADQGTFRFNEVRLKGENTNLVVNGSFTLLKQWGLFFKGETDLNLITFFSKKIATAQGKAIMDLAISDAWAEPRLRGELSLKNGKIRVVRFSQSIEIVSLSALFNEQLVVLDHMQGKLGGGDFHAAGKAAISGFGVGDFGFLLELKKVRMDLANNLPATVRGELFFQKEGLEQTLKGELNVKNLVYEKKVDLKNLVTEFIKKRRNALSGETPVIGRTRINIHLYGKENIWISNNVAKLPLIIDLFVRGSFDKPQLLGRIDVPDGEIYFRNNTFKVASAAVSFLSLEEINPTFELNARTDVRNIVTERNYAIDLSLSGTLSQITLTWNSFPSLPEADILALLAVGKTTADFAREGLDAGTEATHFVVTELFADPVEQVTEIVGTPVEKLTGIDHIRVEPSIDNSEANATVGTRLTAEKRLMEDRLVVIYTTTLDPSEEEVIRMVYEVSKNISLVGKRDKDGQIGGDIRFRFEFR